MVHYLFLSPDVTFALVTGHLRAVTAHLGNRCIVHLPFDCHTLTSATLPRRGWVDTVHWNAPKTTH